jgi:hypothetical protein
VQQYPSFYNILQQKGVSVAQVMGQVRINIAFR